jgi:hypothetical protein
MGYYSDVVIQCAVKAYDIIKEAYEGVGVKPCKILIDAYDKSRIIKFDSIEWDTYCPNIAAISKAIYSLDNDKYAGDEDYAYKFIRIGENCGDIEENYNDIGYGAFGDLFPMMDIHIPDKNFECDEMGIPILCDAIESVLDSNDFSVISISEQSGIYIAELETFSPAGENIICDIQFDGTTEGFIAAFEKYANDFDVDEYDKMRIESRGKVNGVFNSVMPLSEEVESMKEILKNAAKKLGSVKTV